MTSLAALPAFLAHFVAGLALLGAAFLVFTRLTPHDELALVRAGEFREAQVWWRRAYRLTPAGLSYRESIGERLALLDQFLASEAGQSAR